MSRENLDAVERLYASWERGDLSGLHDLLHPDVEYVNPAGAIEPGVRHGLPAFEEAIRKLQEAGESWRMYPERFVASGDQVAVEVRYEARARSSGITVQGRESALVTLRDGRVVTFEWFHDPGDAFAAAGLDA